jgi:1-deoxy-D-xylulose-5-phosphate reductoisomerase
VAQSFTKLAILGSTGSIGRQCLSVVESLPERFRVMALAAGANLDELAGQVERHRPELVSVGDAANADELAKRLAAKGISPMPAIHHGREGMLAVGTHAAADMVVSAAVGVVGLEATYEAIKLGRNVALSNKEVLVAAGELVMAAAKQAGRELLPVDSEHNAVHQCLRGGRMEEVERIWLTASGGPFLNTPRSEFSSITVEQALNHPTWKMGKRITIDSATLMNKGFEVIEACRLFHLPPAKVEVLVHPQSTIHSMVEFVDGSILAQFSATDMRLPILYALTYPERIQSDMRFPVGNLRHLDFCPPDMSKFPCLRLAYEAAEAGGAKTVALNAADEVAVAAFLEGGIAFDEIARIIEDTVSASNSGKLESIAKVLEADAEARRYAQKAVLGINRKTAHPRATSVV